MGKAADRLARALRGPGVRELVYDSDIDELRQDAVRGSFVALRDLLDDYIAHLATPFAKPQPGGNGAVVIEVG
jgi:hypothetical protein